MKLINKSTFKVSNINDKKLSGYNFNTLAILDEDSLYQDVEIEEGVFESQFVMPNSKHIKQLNNILDENIPVMIGNFNVVSIIEMNESEKQVVINNETEADRISSFKGFPIKITAREKLLKTGKKFAALAFDLLVNNPSKDYFEEEGKKYITAYLKYLRTGDGFVLNPDGSISSPDSDLVLSQINNNFEIGITDEDESIIQIIQES